VWDSGARAIWKLKGGNDRTSLALQGMLELGLLLSSDDAEVLLTNVIFLRDVS